MEKIQVTPQDIDKVKEIQEKIKSYDKIGAIVASAELAYNLVRNSDKNLSPESQPFKEIAETLAEKIYEQERANLGFSPRKILKKSQLRKSSL